MMKLHNKKKSKQIIIILVIITLCNFVMPKAAYAKDGGTILKELTRFTLFVCDKIMGALQNSFISPEDIEIEEKKFKYQYSPAIIFSGQVPAFDIDFINPMPDKVATKKFGSRSK